MGYRWTSCSPHDTEAWMNRYDPLIAPNPEEWLALDEQHRLDLIADYHRRIKFQAQGLQTHFVIHSVVENQVAEGDELPVRRTLERLMNEGLNRHDAIHAVGSVLAQHIHATLAGSREGADGNAEYYRDLEVLTAKSWLGSGSEGRDPDAPRRTGRLRGRHRRF
jgi:hypothetical protein